MKAITRFFIIVLMIVLLNTALPQAIIKINNNPLLQIKGNVIEWTYEDCYTYKRVFINGEWWIYVYDCDGILIKMYLENEEWVF